MDNIENTPNNDNVVTICHGSQVFIGLMLRQNWACKGFTEY